MPFQPPKTTLGWTRPAASEAEKPLIPAKPKAKPPRDLRVKLHPRAQKRMMAPGKAGGR